MSRYAIVRGGAAFEVTDAETYIALDGTPHTIAADLSTYLPAFLPSLGLYPIQPAPPAPAGSVWTGDEKLKVVDVEAVAATDSTPAVPFSRTVQAYYDETVLQLDQVRADTLVALSGIRSTHMGAMTLSADFGGATIVSDDTTCNRIDNAIRYLGLKQSGTVIDFEVTPGSYAEFTVDQMSALGEAIGDHWQACFANSKMLAAQITAATDPTTILAIDLTVGWPS